jgi:Dolichyl-phosphate-mannose-protein mannosyltransferase
MNRIINIIYILALIIGIGGRLWGAWVNNESNDNHVHVVQRIIANESIAHKDSCWECFQPPFFYETHAKLPTLTTADSRRELIQQMQLVNALLSLLAIFFIHLSIRDLYGKGRLHKIAISFCLLNPALFTMGIQGTNDTPVILLATISVWLLIRYVRKPRLQTLAMIGLTSFAATYFKGSGLAIFLMFTTWLIIFAIRNKHYLALTIPLGAMLILVFSSHYRYNYEVYGDAFQTNLNKTIPPPFFDDGQDFWARPGITSIWNSYGQFRLWNMLKTPYNINVNEGPNFPKHRTSFWSQMYGSFLNTQFLQHPYSWENKHPDRLNMVRVIFVLGIFLIIGLVLGIWKILKSTQGIQDILSLDFIFLSIVMGMLFFNLKYTYDYRDFGCIKAIFMLPVMLPMLKIFAEGWRSIKGPNIRFAGTLTILAILLLSAADLVILVTQLTLIAYGYIVIV